MRGIGIVLAATALAGCAGGLPLGPDVVVSGRQFVAAQGEADVVVRAFVLDDAGERSEVAGAACDVTTSLYDAKLTTPARMRVPNFGPQSPVLNIACAALGLKGAVQQPIAIYWRTAPGYYYGGYYGPPWYGPGAGWYGPGWGFPGPSYPVSEYPDVAVILR